MAATVTVNGDAIAHVRGVEIEYPEAFAQITGDGGEVTSERLKGAIINVEVQLGREAGQYAALLGLRDAGSGPYTIVVTDGDGGTDTYVCNWKRKPPKKIGGPSLFQAITITFTEQA